MKEKLSSLIDDELDELDERRVLNALATDAELRRTWGRYHLIRAAVTRQLGTMTGSDLSDRVLARLDAEVPAAAPALRFWPLAGGFAAAASLAAVAILGLQTLRGPTGVAPVTPLAVAPSPITELAVSTATAPSPAENSVKNSEERLSQYLVGHNEFMPTAGMGSMLPYVRVVAHSPDK